MAKKQSSSKNASKDASQQKKSVEQDENFRHIVRVANTDLHGGKPLYLALQKIKGVGENFARIACKISGYDTMTLTGTLSEKQAGEIEVVIKDPVKAGIPSWMYNAQKDYESGEDFHLLHSDLDFKQDNDIKRKKKMKSNVGLRHQWKLPVRGQRTKSHFRPNAGKGSAVKKRSSIRK
ncbi:MAG: 30S ribosomal protein S13 [Candidatus Woesearchaeota archaeon]